MSMPITDAVYDNYELEVLNDKLSLFSKKVYNNNNGSMVMFFIFGLCVFKMLNVVQAGDSSTNSREIINEAWTGLGDKKNIRTAID